MAMFKVTFMVEASRTDFLVNKLKKMFSEEEIKTQVEKVQKAPSSRAERLSEAESEFESATSTVEELRDEMTEWKDSIPENLQGGNKYSEVEEAESALDDLINEMENIDFSNVSFPSIF